MLNQIGLGSCAMFSCAEADFTMENAAKDKAGQALTAQLAHPGFMYEQVRRRRGWFPNDTGSYPSDGLDMLMTDTPLMSRHEYISNAAFDYDDSEFINPKPIDYLKSYRYIYVQEGNALDLTYAALQQRCGLVICMYWPSPYFSPVKGMLPEGVQWKPTDGAHAVSGFGVFPDRGGVVGASNHWTPDWNREAPTINGEFRPGDFGIPSSFFLPDKGSPVFMIIAVSPEEVEIEPEPEPQPDPKSTPVIDHVKYQDGKKLKVTGSNFHEDADVFLDEIEQSVSPENPSQFKFKVKGLHGAHGLRITNPGGGTAKTTFTV